MPHFFLASSHGMTQCATVSHILHSMVQFTWRCLTQHCTESSLTKRHCMRGQLRTNSLVRQSRARTTKPYEPLLMCFIFTYLWCPSRGSC